MTSTDRIVRSRLNRMARVVSQKHTDSDTSDLDESSNESVKSKLPPGQHETKKWPVLDLGIRPTISTETWSLTLKGHCKYPQTLSWNAFKQLKHIQQTSDFHCVTTWSRFDLHWEGVPFKELVALACPDPKAQFVLCHGYDGYSTNLSLEHATNSDVLLVHQVDNQPLSYEHGGPVRMITPQLYAWKGTKWISAIEFLTEESLGFWELRGYSNTADPWTDDRYSDPHSDPQ